MNMNVNTGRCDYVTTGASEKMAYGPGSPVGKIHPELCITCTVLYYSEIIPVKAAHPKIKTFPGTHIHVVRIITRVQYRLFP